MISEIQFPALDTSAGFSYAAKLAFFQQNTQVTFQPGLNILFGPNGCGKSTILRMAALTLAAEQGGISTITSSWLDEVFDRFKNANKLEGIKVLHDGEPILYGNPRNAVGLYGGGAAFDDDFMMEGLQNIQSKLSTGYTTMQRLGRMLATVQGETPFPAKIDDRIGLLKRAAGKDKDDVLALKLLKASILKGQRTLIFDEPESGLGIPAQRNVFNMLYAAARKNDFQLIIATHSVFALGLPGANYIEMQPDYLGHSKNAVSSVHVRLELERMLAESEAAKPAEPSEPAAAKPKRKSPTSTKGKSPQ